MTTEAERSEWHARTVRAWLLALLRYAVTLDNDDRLGVFAAAAHIDNQNSAQSDSGFRFFARTSADLCSAIANPAHPGSAAILTRHLARVTDDRLKRAFAAALERDHLAAKPKAKPIKLKPREDLWRGLRC